jgi:hypothetical protein
MLGLGQIVRGRPSASAAVGDDCHSLRHSAAPGGRGRERPSPVAGWADIPELSTCVGCCSAAWLQSWLQSRRNGGYARGLGGLTRRLCPAAAMCPVTARIVQGMAPCPGQARCLALGFWPECFRRLNVKGGRRPFPKETRSALDIEEKHVTIHGPSPDPSPATTLAPSACATWLSSLLIRRHGHIIQDRLSRPVRWADFP